MIAGIGTDIVEINRMARIVKADAGKFKVFTEKEYQYCDSKADHLQHYAARWAAKEAFFKAWGDPDIAKSDIEVIHDIDGQPKFRFHNINRPADFRVSLSLSHDGEYAIAYVIVEA